MAKIQTNNGKIMADLVAALASYGILPQVGGPSFRPPYGGGEPDLQLAQLGQHFDPTQTSPL
ncbi:hypothetical protein SLEP1_g49130 [Rubroshorea leprosula]|uniref:Uncharacterized protein n=1 Tax=Rubroshorea leprosula TaxID=152421 RepID=A0AAV5LX14_9ROSI|nr:hypothetical protein SLEP1_g49130 [Rubroshorea leprosula]